MARYALSRSPRSVARRVFRVIRAALARRADVRIAHGRDLPQGRPELSADRIDAIWGALAARPFATTTGAIDRQICEATCPGETARVLTAAENALRRQVDLLGSGPIQLGDPIDWLRDYKSGIRWERRYAPTQNYAELDRPSDVKFPWELSRLQWLIPLGQAYLLTGEDRFAKAVRDVVDEWIAANPYSFSVNWAIAMEPALRIVSWTWFFHVFARSEAWREPGFRQRFLSALFAHGDFVERHLEQSDVNGNHYTADATGLVFVGLFFGDNVRAQRWAALGWRILTTELPRQVHADGVDFESSSAYHRLATELFLLPAIYRSALGLQVSSEYRRRLSLMGSFVASYSRHDGTSPIWGDADDGRALPLGGQSRNDHRYLIGVIARWLSDSALESQFSGPRSEVFWLLGAEAAAVLPVETAHQDSRAFVDAGVYVMRSEADHVFIDCGAVGMAGRGGHGHNDCLSFELVLDNALLITDSGTYVYTASREWRNWFRGTASHNTPVVDDAEQNRLLHTDFLWALRNDARPLRRSWISGPDFDALVAGHTGYRRLPSPVEPTRTFVFDKKLNRLVVRDEFTGNGDHSIRVPFHFPPDVQLSDRGPDRVAMSVSQRRFLFAWCSSADWKVEIRESWVSPSYGIKYAASCLEFNRTGPLKPLIVLIAPEPFTENVERATHYALAAAGLNSPMA
jgi:uncharacterized heparinase superfamily protein